MPVTSLYVLYCNPTCCFSSCTTFSAFMNYIDSRRVWSCFYWSQWQDFHEMWYMLTIHLIAPQKAMKISSGRRQVREMCCVDFAAGQLLRSAPALKLITDPQCCFGSQDRQHGGGMVVVLLWPGDSWQLPAKGHSTPPRISAGRSALLSPHPDAQLTTHTLSRHNMYRVF